MSRRSKFQDLLDQRETQPDREAPPLPEAAPTVVPTSVPAQSTTKALAKSKDPNYLPVTMYVRKTTYQHVQMRLLSQGRRREVSELSNALFEAWLAAQE